jgi:phospholipid/cholesterol/gamma-HCH transport system permease protein
MQGEMVAAEMVAAVEDAAEDGPRERGWLSTAGESDHRILTAMGRWDIAAAGRLSTMLAALAPKAADGGAGRGPQRIRLDLGRLESLDTVGALLLRGLRNRLAAQGWTVTVINVQAAHAALLDTVWRAADSEPNPRPRLNRVATLVAGTGRRAIETLESARGLVAFFGLVCITLARLVRHPGRLRVTALVYHMEHTGLRALPILGLLSFLIGVVLAYQGAEQLRRVAAEIYVVNLLSLSILREIGILITAIIVAGRSGSAFTAQIGTMKVNQEIDAMLTIGLDPMELLVAPRILALMVVLPLITFYANMVALFGGAVMSYVLLDINFAQFINQMRIPIDFNDATVAMIKAPVFALVIAMVGCYEGLLVSGSAESVGLRTTRSVVESIFLVIVLNAFFSILFSMLHI